jgi:DNA-binding MarR family transcriptional regulator
MNDQSTDFLDRQTQRLRDLITEMIRCCEGRNLLEMKRFSLPYAELKCLTLFKGERYLTVKGMSQKLGVTKSRVTKLVDGLSSKGLVNRTGDPVDGRITLISLSAKGKTITDEVERFQEGLYREVLLQLEADERTDILSHLGTLTSVMEAVKRKFST